MDAETFKTRFTEAFSTAVADLADTLSDQIVEMISGEETEAEGEPKERQAPAAAKRDAGQLKALREACKKNGRSAEFDALEKSGAEISELRSLLVASIRTSDVEIDSTQKPSAGARSLKDIKFENTTAGKRAGARS